MLSERLDQVIDALKAGGAPDSTLDFPQGPLGEAIDGLLPVMPALVDAERELAPALDDSLSHRLIGARLGDFRILREIGRGGMGVVFEARQISLDRRVALKVLPLNAASHAASLARFEREAQAAASLEHPRIVRAYARGEERGVYFLAMQYIAGSDLAKHIRQCRSAAEQGADSPGSSSGTKAAYFHEIARWGQQAAEAIDFAHSSQIIHRDIKPSNLILDERGNVWVADFGLALLERPEQLTTTGRFLGTLRYSSPEQVRSAAVARSGVSQGLGGDHSESDGQITRAPIPNRAGVRRRSAKVLAERTGACQTTYCGGAQRAVGATQPAAKHPGRDRCLAGRHPHGGSSAAFQ